MPVRIITVPFDSGKEIFQDEVLTRFLLNKRVETLKPEFFTLNGNAYWTVFLVYEPILDEMKNMGEKGMDQAQSLLFKRLRQWRKEKADHEGVPVFIIATNKQLEEVVKTSPKSLEALRQIHGFGKKKVERHGEDIEAWRMTGGWKRQLKM